MRDSTAKPALLAFLVVFVGVVAIFAVTPDATADDHEDGDNRTYTSQVMLWSLDEEGVDEDTNYTLWDGMSRSYDRVYDDPTPRAQEWNEDNVREFSGGGLDRSVYPTSANPQDSGRIKDAYIQIHSVTPMTITHLGDYRGAGQSFVSEQSSYNYIRPDSEVNVVWDYRIESPTTSTTYARPPDGSDADRNDDSYTIRRVENHTVEEVRMEYDGDTYSRETNVYGSYTTLSPEDDPSENTEFPTYGDPTPITVTAEITSNVHIIEWTQEEWCDPCHDHDYDADGGGCAEREDIDDDNETECVDWECGPCHSHDYTWHEEWEKDESWDNDTITVSDQSRDVIGYYVGAFVEYAHMPDGSSQLEFYQYGSSMTPVWDGVTLPDGTEANTMFRYYTTRDTTWDVMNESTASGTETIRNESQAQPRAHWYDYSDMRPVLLHAYPADEGTYVGSPGARLEPIETGTFGARGPPTLQDNINVTPMSEEYEVVNHIIANQNYQYDLTYNENNETIEELEVKGIVPGTSADVYEPEKTEVYEPQFDVQVDNVDRDNKEITYTITVESHNGTPINTGARDGANITIDGDEYQTGEDGNVTLTVDYENTENLYLNYNSVPWYDYLNTDDANSDMRFTDTERVVDVEPVYSDNVMLIYRLTYLLVVPWIPLLLFIWMFDRILDIGIWPPWRRFF